MGHTSIDSEIDRLYGLALEEFTKERDALARRLRADGNRDDAASVAGLRKPVGEAYPEPRLLEKLVAAGVPVTFSSDAHAPAEVGWGYDRTLALAHRAGVREFVTLERRRKRTHPLPPP